MKRNNLQTIVCLPCDQSPPAERFIIAKVTDGDRTQFIKFGRDLSMRTVMSQIPIIYQDRAYDKRRRKGA